MSFASITIDYIYDYAVRVLLKLWIIAKYTRTDNIRIFLRMKIRNWNNISLTTTTCGTYIFYLIIHTFDKATIIFIISIKNIFTLIFIYLFHDALKIWKRYKKYWFLINVKYKILLLSKILLKAKNLKFLGIFHVDNFYKILTRLGDFFKQLSIFIW